jgi:hypothetical protein
MAYGNTPNKKRSCYKMKAGAEGPFQKNFPDLTGDGKVTQADVLKGRGVLPQKALRNVTSTIKPKPKPVKTDSEQRKEYIKEQLKKGR